MSSRFETGVVMDAALLDAQRLRVCQPRPFPWTRSIIGAALGHALVRPCAMRPLAIHSDDLALVGRRTRLATPISPSAPAASATVAPKRRRLRLDTIKPDDARFVAVVDMWATFLTGDVGLQHCSACAKLLDEGRDGEISDELRVIFAGKHHATMSKRLGALSLFAKWCHKGKRSAFPLLEGTAFAYLKTAATQAPTRGQSFVSAVAFAKGCVGLHGAREVLESIRCSGAMYAGLETKKCPEQATPLTVDMVGKLERWQWTVQTIQGTEFCQASLFSVSTPVFASAMHCVSKQSLFSIFQTSRFPHTGIRRERGVPSDSCRSSLCPLA